ARLPRQRLRSGVLGRAGREPREPRVVNGNQRRRARRPLTAFGVRRSAFWVLGSGFWFWFWFWFWVLGSAFWVLVPRFSFIGSRRTPNAEPGLRITRASAAW